MRRRAAVAAFALLGLAMCSAPASAATPEQREVFAGSVRVGADGNGAFASTFDAPAPGLSYLLVVDNGCRATDPGDEASCPAALNEITVSLNGDVVFERDDEFAHASARLPGPIGAENNQILIAARGAPGSAAHVRILATPKPDARRLFARSVRVGSDGNGAVAARFDTPTTPDLTYTLVVDTGCQSCPAPVNELTITLNDDVVFQRDGDITHHTTRLANLDTGDNTILISAAGAPGSTAHIRILATVAKEPKPKPPHREVFADSVRVGSDGNGAFAATFDAPAPGLRYLLLVDNGCRASDPGNDTSCPAGVNEISISLNEQVVFERDDDFAHATARLPGRIRAESNRILIAARGAPGSTAHIRIIASPKDTSGPRPKPKGRKEIFHRSVRVGSDGNGAVAARFDTPTTPSLTYRLVVDTGCESCPPPVNQLTITLNNEVVFQREGDLTHHTTRLSNLNVQDNTILIAAGGSPGSAARIRIIATPA